MANQKDTHTRRSSPATPFLRFALGAAVVVSLLVAFQQAGGGNASLGIHGDVDCSGTADTIDSLQVILSVAELDASTECAAENGDVNCDHDVDIDDSLRILRHVHDDQQTLDGCSPRGLAQLLHEETSAPDADALLIAAVYAALDIGLYTGDGVQILAGAEVDLETDFYLYTFESDLLARHYVERQLYGIDTLTLFLTEAGLDAGGDPLTDADVLALLASNVTASRSDETMFAWRLIDELALVRGLDLTDTGLDLETLQLDGLQIFLALHNLASALAASEIQASVAITDTPSQALHDWASRNVAVVAAPVEPTHWRHGDTSPETRTFTLTVSYPSEQVVITSGPLEGFSPSQFLGEPSGYPVWWYPEAGLTPDNGVWQNRVSSFDTDSAGNAKRDFRPALECPPGQGAERTNTFEVVIKVQPLYKSIFPPHTVIGLASVFEETNIQIGRHGGTSAQSIGAAGIVTDPLIAGVAGQPCAYEGSANATQVHPYGNGSGQLIYTITAENLRFELLPNGNYDLVRGNVLVTASGQTATPCTFSGGSAIPEPMFEPGGRSFSGSIIVDQSTHKYLALGLAADHDVVHGLCGDLLDYEVSWLRTSDLTPDRAFTGGSLAGSFDWTNSASISGHTEWDLHPAECQPSSASVTPQGGGTCGGAAAFPRAW